MLHTEPPPLKYATNLPEWGPDYGESDALWSTLGMLFSASLIGGLIMATVGAVILKMGKQIKDNKREKFGRNLKVAGIFLIVLGIAYAFVSIYITKNAPIVTRYK